MPTTTRSPTQQRPLSAGWGPRRLRYPRSAAALAYVVGTPATAVGAGIAVRHVTTAGLTGTSAVGLVLVIAGLAQLVFAGTVLWRGTHRWQRLWFVPVIVLTLLLMSSVMIGAMLAVAPRNDLGS